MESFAIEIIPFDFHSKVKFDNWFIQNEFKRKGFYSPSAFITIVCEYIPEKNNEKGRKRLKNFWYSLVNDPNLNKKLFHVLGQLKAE